MAQDQIGLFSPCVDGLQVSINGSATNNPTSIGWSWGDGSDTAGWFPENHFYASAGLYTVQVTAYYSDGSNVSTSETVNAGASGGCPFTFSPASLIFGVQTLGTTSGSQSVTLTNTSGGTLTLTIAASGDFGQTNTCGSGVAAGASCTISVTFTPYTSGSLSGTVSIGSSSGALLMVSLTGTGGAIKPTLFPSKVNFGSQQVGVNSLPLNVKFTNWGAAPISITSIKPTGADAGDFKLTNTCGSSVAAGVSCEISVTFMSATTGSKSATLTVVDSGNGSPQKVPLSGAGATFPAETLSVTITGLPSGTNGVVTVTGPSGYSKTLAQTTTLNNLTPGTYTIIGTVVSSASASNTVYVPILTGSPAAVTSGTGAAATVSYSKLVANWKTLGPSAIGGSSLPAAGKLQAFAVSNADPSVMYAAGGVQPGSPYSETGVYKTTNGGSAWSQKNSGLTDPTVSALWLDQSNTNIVLAGTDSGIFRSINGGGSWALASGGGLGLTLAFSGTGNTIYAATSGGVATSTNNGASWSIPSGYQSPPGVQVLTLAQGGGYAYAGLANGQLMVQSSPLGPWVLTTPTNGGTPTSIAVSPTSGQNAFVVEWMNYQSPDIYTTENAGTSWTPLSDLANCPLGPAIGQQAQQLAFESTSATLYAGCDGYSDNGTESPLWLSSNGGSSWSQIPTDGGWDMRLIDTDAEGAPGDLLVGSDQGLYLSTNNGGSWQSLNGNITSSILYSVGVANNTILTVEQDFSIIGTFDDGALWEPVGGAEAGTLIFNPANPFYVYSFTTAGFQYSENGGQTFTPVAVLPGLGAGGEFPRGGNDLVAVDPNNASTVYVAAVSGVYKSTDWGVSWTLQSSWPFGPTATTPNMPQLVAVSPVDSQTIFVGVCNLEGTACNNQGAVWSTNDGGISWNPTSNLGAGSCGWPETIAINPANAQTILLAMTGSPSCGILRSTDGGASFSSPPNTGLTQRQAQCNTVPFPHLQVDTGASGAVAAATPGGVYISTDFGLKWTSIRGNTVPLSVTEAIWSGGNLYESTCGEGVLRLSFPF